jgi:transposase-like protein
MTIKITNPIFADENQAREHLESLLWPSGPVCPRCGVTGEGVNKLPVGRSKASKKHPEGKPVYGQHYCNACRRTFTVTNGTVMERSHIPLTAWVAAFHLYAASKKGFSAHQLHRSLGLTYKSAWFLAMRVREAMGETGADMLGGEGKIVEVDETYFGPGKKAVNRKTGRHVKASGTGGKQKVVSLVERGGSARSFHVENADTATIQKIVLANVSRETVLMTDEAQMYPRIASDFAGHGRVMHSAEEWVRGDAHSNTVEGFFSVFKRGMKGVYQHCDEKHLHRYLREYDFRYSNRIALGVDDTMRAERVIRGAKGKRLTYRQPH